MYLAILASIHMSTLIMTMIIVYETNCLIKLRSTTCVSLSRSTISSLVDPMTRDHLDTNIITHDRNFIVMISIMISFLLCLCIMDFINLI